MNRFMGVSTVFIQMNAVLYLRYACFEERDLPAFGTNHVALDPRRRLRACSFVVRVDAPRKRAKRSEVWEDDSVGRWGHGEESRAN